MSARSRRWREIVREICERSEMMREMMREMREICEMVLKICETMREMREIMREMREMAREICEMREIAISRAASRVTARRCRSSTPT